MNNLHGMHRRKRKRKRRCNCALIELKEQLRSCSMQGDDVHMHMGMGMEPGEFLLRDQKLRDLQPKPHLQDTSWSTMHTPTLHINTSNANKHLSNSLDDLLHAACYDKAGPAPAWLHHHQGLTRGDTC